MQCDLSNVVICYFICFLYGVVGIVLLLGLCWSFLLEGSRARELCFSSNWLLGCFLSLVSLIFYSLSSFLCFFLYDNDIYLHNLYWLSCRCFSGLVHYCFCWAKEIILFIILKLVNLKFGSVIMLASVLGYLLGWCSMLFWNGNLVIWLGLDGFGFVNFCDIICFVRSWT